MKTGTTAVQSVLRQHDGTALIYPKNCLYAGAHHKLVFNYFSDKRVGRSGEADFQEQMQKIRQRTRKNDLDVIISSEALIPMGWQPPSRVDAGEFIRAILPFIGPPAPDVEILITCREHFSWAASTYNQRLKANEKRDPDAFIQAHAHDLCIAPKIRKLKESGFNVTPLNYHPSQSWVERFLTHVGFPAQALPQKTPNLSLSPAGLIAKLAVNRVVREKEPRVKLRNKLRHMPEFGASSQFIFGAEASAVAERVFSQDRRILSEEFAIELPPPNLDSPNMFYAVESDIPMIENLVRSMGMDVVPVMEVVQQFVRG